MENVKFTTKYIIEIHNDESYEEYSYDTICVCDTFEQAEQLIKLFGYYKSEDVYIYDEDKLHNKVLLNQFFDSDYASIYSYGYLEIYPIKYFEGVVE